MARRDENEPTPKSRRRRKRHNSVSWSAVDGSTIEAILELMERTNGAVRFGRSRDGSVYSLGFYIGPDRFTEWIRDDDDVDDAILKVLSEITEDYSDEK